jgi:hypothetical protein
VRYFFIWKIIISKSVSMLLGLRFTSVDEESRPDLLL